MYFNDVRNKFFQAVEQLHPSTASTVKDAYNVAEREHQGQLRKAHKTSPYDVDPYLIHPLRVSLIIMHELNLADLTAVASAVLHDVVEDGVNRPTIDDIRQQFGDEIAVTVNYLTKPDDRGGKQDLGPYHQAFFTAPLLVRLVKLSDRLDNLRECLLVDRPAFQTRYLHETRDVYLPLAQKTSSYFSSQLNDLCFQLESLLKQNC